jgi:DNA repair exonuclease SbcCD ATPase subunit
MGVMSSKNLASIGAMQERMSKYDTEAIEAAVARVTALRAKAQRPENLVELIRSIEDELREFQKQKRKLDEVEQAWRRASEAKRAHAKSKQDLTEVTRLSETLVKCPTCRRTFTAKQ